MRNSHHVYWTREPNLRLRPVPEQECCLVYCPSVPSAKPPQPAALHALNLTVWLALTLCDGRDEIAITKGFTAAVGNRYGPGASEAALQSALGQLRALGLVRKSKGYFA